METFKKTAIVLASILVGIFFLWLFVYGVMYHSACVKLEVYSRTASSTYNCSEFLWAKDQIEIHHFNFDFHYVGTTTTTIIN